MMTPAQCPEAQRPERVVERLRGWASPQLNERTRRLVAAESQASHRGGIALVHEVTGLGQATIGRGRGRGRRRRVDTDPTLSPDLDQWGHPSLAATPNPPYGAGPRVPRPWRGRCKPGVIA